MADELKYIPDSTGTVTVKGLEKEVDSYLLEDAYIKEKAAALEENKTKLRGVMQEILDQAQPGSKSVYLVGKKGALRISPPDLEKDGNRPVFSGETDKAVRKAGGLESLGPELDELVESKLVVTLRGDYAARFLAQLKAMIDGGQLEEMPEDVKVDWKRRLKLEGLAGLKALAADGAGDAAEVAKVLLKKGIRAATVKGEESWR
jgi:hypothetical protein